MLFIILNLVDFFVMLIVFDQVMNVIECLDCLVCLQCCVYCLLDWFWIFVKVMVDFDSEIDVEFEVFDLFDFLDGVE